MKKIVTEENSGIALIMQVILIALFSAIVSFVINVNSSKSLIISLIFFILYAIIIHNMFLNNFRKGLRYYRKGEYKDAIIFFQRIYNLFNRHKLLDKLRYFALFSHSKKSYREMSLLNIAFIYSKIGNENESKQTYQKVLDEFPKSFEAKVALKNSDINKADDRKQDINDIKISFCKKKILLLILLTSLFIIPSPLILIDYSISLFLKFIFLISAIFFMFAFIFLIIKYFDTRPGLIIYKNGFMDNTSLASFNFIEWESVESIYYSKESNHKFVRINLFNIEEILMNQSTLIQIIARLNKQRFKGGINISSVLLNCSLLELRSVLQNGFERHKYA